MKQVHLISSGVQLRFKPVLDVSGDRFAYCSTLSAYIHSLPHGDLECLLACQLDRNISCFAFSPHDSDLVVTSSTTKLYLWRLSTEHLEISQHADSDVSHFHLSPHRAVVVYATIDGRVGLWNTESNTTRYISAGISNVSCVRWNHRGGVPTLFCGNRSGELSLYTERSAIDIDLCNFKNESAVIDARWDPLSNNYIIVAFANGGMVLVDAEARKVISDFEMQSTDLSMIDWHTAAPGEFVSVCSKTASLRIWHVSQRACTRILRLGGNVPREGGCIGIKAFGPSTSISPFAVRNSKFLVTFCDGAVGVYDLAKHKMLWTGEPGHSETVFAGRFQPCNPRRFATASYDGRCKIWSIDRLSCEMELTGQPGALYSLAWAPGDTKVEPEQRIITASSKGALWIWSTRTGLPLQKLQLHNLQSYVVTWASNPAIDLVASTSLDYTCVVFSPTTGDVRTKIKLDVPILGCDFNTLRPNLFAIGCDDLTVKVYDLAICSKTSPIPAMILNGHASRVFHTVWSPLLPDHLASGSDDRTIIVWNIDTRQSRPLQGHTHHVRALVWHTELPHILLSGSWDGSIRMWDIRTQSCIHVLSDHHADVYTVSVHPERPFLFVSSSRDTSVRLWSLELPETNSMRLRCLLADCMLPDDILVDQPAKLMRDHADSTVAPSGLCGTGSRNLQFALSTADQLERFKLVLEFFGVWPDLDELFGVLDTHIRGTPSASDAKIVHASDRRRQAQLLANQLERDRTVTFASGSSRADRLAHAAEVALLAGDVLTCCEMLVKNNQWQRALCLAPGAGLEYWRQLCRRHAASLCATNDHDCVQFQIASGDVEGAAAWLQGCGESENALAVISAHAVERVAHVHTAADAIVSAPVDDNSTYSAATLAQAAAAASPTMRSLTNEVAQRDIELGRPLRAAAHFVSSSDCVGAVRALLQAGEFDSALAVVLVLERTHDSSVEWLRVCADVWRAAAFRCEGHSLWSEATVCWRHVQSLESSLPDDTSVLTAQQQLLMLCARHPGSLSTVSLFHASCGAPTLTELERAADRLPAAPQTDEALFSNVLALVAARRLEAAVELVLPRVLVLIDQSFVVPESAGLSAFVTPSTSLAIARRLLAPIAAVSSTALPNAVRARLFTAMLFVSALDAAERVYQSASHMSNPLAFVCDAAPIINRLFESAISQANGASFSVPIALIRARHAEFLALYDCATAAQRLQALLTESLLPHLHKHLSSLHQALVSTGTAIQIAAAAAVPSLGRRWVKYIPAGSMVPSSVATRTARPKSCLTGVPIPGGHIVRLPHSDQAVSRAEALAWTQVSSLSPLLDGSVFNPY